jgi:hypothetical protein
VALGALGRRWRRAGYLGAISAPDGTAARLPNAPR